MKYFLETSDTIQEGLGFSHFDSLHIAWLLVFAAVTVTCCIVYRKLGEDGRKKMRYAVASLCVLDEWYMVVCLLIGGNYTPDYLPFHVCSINIYLIAFHALKPNKVLGNYLYLVGIPGTLAALIFPSWVKLPLANFMHLHSFTLHILLVLYPIMLTAGGDIKPEPRQLPRCLALLLGLAGVALVVNLIFDTNFMFLMEAKPGNPLYIFQQLFGNHLFGFPIIITAVILVMYLPGIILKKRRGVHNEAK